MPSIPTAAPTASRSGTLQRRTQYARWAKLLDTVLPRADENRLVRATEISRGALPLDADVAHQMAAGA